MGRTSPRLSNFCLNRVTSRIRVRSPPVESRPISDRVDQFLDSTEKNSPGNGAKTGSVVGRRIMIVVDSSPEAKGALQWALSYTVQNQDVVILLYVTKPSKQGEEQEREINPRGYELLYTMKNTCHVRKPEVQVEVSIVEGKEKGPTIVEEARKQGVSLLVLGQRKRSMTWRLLMTWAGNRIGGGVVEYCIQNADCMALAVRRKSRKVGGYLITTKRHKDFWLLA
ncbi:adenine nucleotide alpha hydrolases-like superfamily protein [Tasmannia lanceolata]|uniref:adenine nucleotide alpha hydrolases-like superfamily protein n=1 Tax=Tasmannia lanceolata TaxID=3420 RepID=UPI0040633CEE